MASSIGRPQITPDEKLATGWRDYIRATLTAGVSLSELKAELGVSNSTHYRWLRDEQEYADIINTNYITNGKTSPAESPKHLLRLARRRSNRKPNKPRFDDKYRSLLRHVLTGNLRSSRTMEHELGYSPDEFRTHIQLLLKDGMTLDNYGEWCIDHIVPVGLFDYSSCQDEEFKKCWSLDNLRPYWTNQNLLKGYRVIV